MIRRREFVTLLSGVVAWPLAMRAQQGERMFKAMARATTSVACLLVVAASTALLGGGGGPAVADKGDKAGWSLTTDPRTRAFLKFVPTNDGPRILVLGCLRDVDSFMVLSEQGVASTQTVVLTLSNGTIRYTVEGKIEPDGAGVGQVGFVSEFDVDAKARQQLRVRLLPVLEGKGPIVMTLGSISRELPASDLSAPLRGFKSVCFG